jgi:hypothetical protein
VAIPRPLRREVLGHRLQDQRCRPWPSPLGNRLGSSLTHQGRSGVTTLQASLDVADWSVAPTPLRTRPLDHARRPRYRGPWRLPGPDSHRLAALSLSLGYVTTTSLSSWRPSCWTHSPNAGPGLALCCWVSGSARLCLVRRCFRGGRPCSSDRLERLGHDGLDGGRVWTAGKRTVHRSTPTRRLTFRRVVSSYH